MPRSAPFRRARRPAIAALAVAIALIAAPSRAQNAEPAWGLRGAGADQPPPFAPTGAEPPAFGVDLAPADPTSNPLPNAQKNDKKEKQKKLKKKESVAGPPLPGLRPYRDAERIGRPGGPPTADPVKTPSPTIASLPPPPLKRRPHPEDKPFDPTGIALGDFTLLPSLEEDVGYATNPAMVTGPTKGSTFESTQATLGLQSNWARSDLHGTLSAGYIDYFADRQVNVPNGNGALDGRLDVSRDLSFDAEGRFNVTAQQPGSVTLPTGAVLGSNARPLVETAGATLGGVQKFGDLALSLHGTIDRTTYQNATLSNGAVDDLASDDFNDFGLKGRLAYQISPVITPFIETVIDTTRYDRTFDSSGFDRQSNGALARVGAKLAFTGQLIGEASVGYGERRYEDPRLPDLRAPLVDASIIWSATPLTSVTLKTSTSLNDTTNAGDSGAVTRSYTIDVSHALLRNFTLGANAGYTSDVFAGAPLRDSTTSFGLHAEYNINRDIVLRASATHAQFASTAPGSSFVANVFLLGLRFQR